MSLFPAYSTHSQDKSNLEARDTQSWLSNSSFPTADTNTNDSETNKPNRSDRKRKHKHKTKLVKKKKRLASPDREPSEPPNEMAFSRANSQNFTIQSEGARELLTVETIARPAVPRYKVTCYISHKWRAPRKFRRYHQPSSKKNDDFDLVVTKVDANGVPNVEFVSEGDDTLKQEEELSKRTETFNKELRDEPNNIKLWLEYVRFQNDVYEFEKNCRKGSMAKAQRVLAERKIAIIEKALISNPNNNELTRERVRVATNAYPPDELQQQLSKLVEKQKDNIILWQGYIESSQCSMAHCNTPNVIALYSKCLSTLHQLRRSATQLEENILRMLYQCALFLKQSGLFERLWTLLRLYLELNLTPSDKNLFNITSGFSESQLQNLEDTVFTSQLPLHELWLRTEKLRESCHWLPVSDDCEDPQRLVFTEDVAELIHPITIDTNVFKLVAMSLTLLKVPLLPCRHTTMTELGLDYVPWSLDSIETLLAAYYPLYTADAMSDNIFGNAMKLAVGPQYLKVLPAQEEYLEFVLATMQSAAGCLDGDRRDAVIIWWVRFLKLLIVLGDAKLFKMPQYLKKKITRSIKNCLRQEEYRSNDALYAEYALVEYELGNSAACISALQTAITMNKNMSISAEYFSTAQINQCFLYRTLIECYLKENERKKALESLTQLALLRDFEKLTNGILLEAKTKFSLITNKIKVKNFEKHEAVQNFLPNFETDWIICNAYFLYLTGEITEVVTFIKEIIKSIISTNDNDEQYWQIEILHEFLVSILFQYCSKKYDSSVNKTFNKFLIESISLFPNNLYMLSILAKEESSKFSLGLNWWKTQNMLLKTNRAIPAIFAIIIVLESNEKLKQCYRDSIFKRKLESGTGLKNRTLALFKKLTTSHATTKSCGLLWRLYLQFVHENFEPKTCREVYYSAVEECPWLKALYMDAAIYIPAELAQIQDLIVEKQLRLHVTPEELEELRK